MNKLKGLPLLILMFLTSAVSAEQYVCTTYRPATTVILKRVEGKLFVDPTHPNYKSEYESLAKLAYHVATHETEEAIWFLEPLEPKGLFGAGYGARVISKTTGTYFMDHQRIEDPDNTHDRGKCVVID